MLYTVCQSYGMFYDTEISDSSRHVIVSPLVDITESRHRWHHHQQQHLHHQQQKKEETKYPRWPAAHGKESRRVSKEDERPSSPSLTVTGTYYSHQRHGLWWGPLLYTVSIYYYRGINTAWFILILRCAIYTVCTVLLVLGYYYYYSITVLK